MNLLRLTAGLVGIVLLAAFPAVAQNTTKEPAVTLKSVKYAGLAEAVVQNRGKVIVVDLWGFF
jgi:hypothetical protein